MDLRNYITSLSENSVNGEATFISPEMAQKALNLLEFLENLGVSTPQVAPGPDGMIGFNWTINNIYSSIEIFPNGALELFQENLITGKVLSIDFCGET